MFETGQSLDLLRFFCFRFRIYLDFWLSFWTDVTAMKLSFKMSIPCIGPRFLFEGRDPLSWPLLGFIANIVLSKKFNKMLMHCSQISNRCFDSYVSTCSTQLFLYYEKALPQQFLELLNFFCFKFNNCSGEYCLHGIR